MRVEKIQPLVSPIKRAEKLSKQKIKQRSNFQEVLDLVELSSKEASHDNKKRSPKRL